MKLNSAQKRALIQASKLGIDHIDTTILHLKIECPEAFHTDRTLRKRRFHHQPASDAPYCGFVVDRNA
ncbi:hypothetical protein LMG27952_07037 [Paraburkholderia hiiakae]|uniref:Uncharacterized protein n=1 Tax=Paraburkholderia hiiakae TaxID=1081782 RepID=A0ABN7IE04_9BURK|nr:hypothetical protein [Paraburkholderia hiiakae]CAD6560090.1 hypothetical protein LMG27952_07037 [Paraburkholderia hiiakae]